MCRLLVVKSENEFDISEHLSSFASICKASKVFQGDGWGCAYLNENNEWSFYKSINPIWDDDFSHLKKTKLLVVHARSAFNNEGIVIENNMPFHDNSHIFIFNGELRGVRIKEEGRIGAEKIFRHIKRFSRNENDLMSAVSRAVDSINQRTNYIRAMNTIMVDKDNIYVSSLYNEDQEYFTIYYRKINGTLVVCSGQYPGEADEKWLSIENNTVRVF
jgi:predicted glutamine amidotransferase